MEAAGPNHSVQYNLNDVLAGDSNFLWDPVAQTLTINGSLQGTVFTLCTNNAMVCMEGNDATGQWGNMFRPFATIQAAEAAAPSPSITNPCSIQILPGEHDITGLVKKPWILWSGAGSSATKIRSDDPIDFANPSFSTGDQNIDFSNIDFLTQINTDIHAIGGIGSGNYTATFRNCRFETGQTWKGRGFDQVFYYTCFSNNTPNRWISCSMSTYATPWFTDGVTPTNTLESQNGLESQLLAFFSLFLGALTVTGNATALLSMIGSVCPGGITVDQPTSIAYFLSAPTFGSVPVSTNGGVIIFVTTTDGVTNASTVSGTLLTDALNTLLAGPTHLDAAALAALNPKVLGRIYFNTDLSKLQFWSGAAYETVTSV